MLDGNIIRMTKSFIIVGAPCSGLRSLIALLTLGLIFAHTINTSFFKKGLFFLSAMPIAIASNILRITTLAIVNDLYGQKVASGFFHDFSGFLVFAFAFIGLFIVGRILEAEKLSSSPVERKHNGRRS
jgi:exosortase